MALRTASSLWIPRIWGKDSGYSNYLVVDASGEKAGFVFRVPATGSLKRVAFRTGNVANNQTIRVSFQDVDPATGLPDGVVDQWRNITIADTDDNVAKETGIISSDGTDGGAKRSVTRGDLLAVVFEHNPFNTGDVFQLVSIYAAGENFEGLSYLVWNTGSWAKVTAYGPLLGLVYDGDVCYHLADVCSFVTAWNWLIWNTGNPNPKRGLKFRLPFPCKVSGCALLMRHYGYDAWVRLYDSDGQSVLQETFLDKDYFQIDSARWCHVKFPSAQALAKDAWYYILGEPTNSMALGYVDVPTAMYFDQADGGQDFHYAERSTGAPTATPTRRPLISLELTGFDDGAGGGGAAMPAVIAY